MSATFEPDPLRRALVLLDRGRPELAEPMLRDAVSDDPGDPFPRAVLALVLSDLERYNEAEDCAREAITLDPELGVAHGALARAFAGRERFRDALAATREAVRLDPEEHLNHELLAACQLAVADWRGARESAEHALRLAPGSATANGLRARALAMASDDPTEWRASAAAALAADPGGSAAHALAAHAHLSRGEESSAVAGFEEALRLDPESRYAQAGLAEALKAQHPLFRPVFRFFMWQQRLSRGARTALIVVPLIVLSALRAQAGNPVVLAVIVAWLAFVLLTWTATPIANLALRLTPRGRAVLPAEAKRSSSLFGALIGCCVLAVGLGIFVDGVFVEAALTSGLLAAAVGSSHALSTARQRAVNVAVVATALTGFLGAALVAAGLTAAVFLALAAFLAGFALIWFVRLAG